MNESRNLAYQLQKKKNPLFFKCNYSRKVLPQIYLPGSIKLSGHNDYDIIPPLFLEFKNKSNWK